MRKDTQAIPIIMLSARSEELDKVRGLECVLEGSEKAKKGAIFFSSFFSSDLEQKKQKTMKIDENADDMQDIF